MGGGSLAMSQKERSRLVVMSRAREMAMTIREASEVTRVSYQRGRRIYKRYKDVSGGLVITLPSEKEL